MPTADARPAQHRGRRRPPSASVGMRICKPSSARAAPAPPTPEYLWHQRDGRQTIRHRPARRPGTDPGDDHRQPLRCRAAAAAAAARRGRRRRRGPGSRSAPTSRAESAWRSRFVRRSRARRAPRSRAPRRAAGHRTGRRSRGRAATARAARRSAAPDPARTTAPSGSTIQRPGGADRAVVGFGVGDLLGAVQDGGPPASPPARPAPPTTGTPRGHRRPTTSPRSRRRSRVADRRRNRFRERTSRRGRGRRTPRATRRAAGV